MAMTHPLPGASGLFQARLDERIKWIDAHDLSAQQRSLARQYLARNDFVRAAAFAWEALVSAACPGYDWYNREEREAAASALGEKFSEAAHVRAFHTIRILRNALAHGSRPDDKRYRSLLGSPERLRDALKRAIDCLLP
jgi:hypothetical protein